MGLLAAWMHEALSVREDAQALAAYTVKLTVFELPLALKMKT